MLAYKKYDLDEYYLASRPLSSATREVLQGIRFEDLINDHESATRGVSYGDKSLNVIGCCCLDRVLSIELNRLSEGFPKTLQ